MIDIVDMARSGNDYAPLPDNPYPCGLTLRLTEQELDKLGIEEVPALGTRAAFYVCGEIVATEESKEYVERRCMTLQIQQMAIEELPDEEEAEDRAAEQAGFKESASKLYPKQKE